MSDTGGYDLKPCAWCQEPGHIRLSRVNWATVYCANPECIGASYTDHAPEAVRRWNRRTEPTMPNTTDDKTASGNPAFDLWCYTAKDPDSQPFPYPHSPRGQVPFLTTFLYRVCDNKTGPFEVGLKVLRAAFEAGQKAGPGNG